LIGGVVAGEVCWNPTQLHGQNVDAGDSVVIAARTRAKTDVNLSRRYVSALPA